VSKIAASEKVSLEATVYLVSCVSQKRTSRSLARDLYTSQWFQKARAYVEARRAPWFNTVRRVRASGPRRGSRALRTHAESDESRGTARVGATGK
jgi:hypothetical protein